MVCLWFWLEGSGVGSCCLESVLGEQWGWNGFLWVIENSKLSVFL